MTIVVREYGRGHTYHVDGVKFDGVTTILNDGVPKPALVKWAAKSVATYVADATTDDLDTLRGLGRDGMIDALKAVPYGQSSAAAAKGTEIHALAEQLVAGQQVDVPEHIAGHVEACVKFLDAYQVKPLAVERPVANRRWRYAGRPDLFAELTLPGGEIVRAVVDWKTGASGIWPEAALQESAYRHAEVWLDEFGVEQPVTDLGLTAGYAVWLRADGYDLVPLDCGEATFKVFCHVAYVARQMKDARSWVGAAIQPEGVHA
jgi:hypothetical protein